MAEVSKLWSYSTKEIRSEYPTFLVLVGVELMALFLFLCCTREENELSTFLTWLGRCEAAAKPSEQYVAADRVNLESELQLAQVSLWVGSVMFSYF